MSAQTVKRRHTSLPRVESISRIQKVPIVQDGTQIASIVYGKIKVLTDPILAMQQATSLWKALSLPEPENQVRPSTVEESLVLLLREVSRRFVHAVNNVTAFVKANWKLKEDMFDIFRLWVDTIVSLRYYMIYSVFKLFLNEGDNDPKTDLAKNPIQLLSETIQKILTRIAMFIAGNPDAFKSVQDPSPQQNRNNHVSQPEREKKSSEREKKSSEKERNSSEKERNSLEKERNSSEKERNSSEKERNSSKKERNSSEKERNSSEKERNSLEKERNSSKKERNSSEEEKKSEERETENCHE